MNDRMRGLTPEEVASRQRDGLTNRVRRSGWLEYGEIIQRNVFTLFNAMVVPAAVVLLMLRDFRAGFAVSGMAVINTVLGLGQEIRAKRKLDQLTLLAEQTVQVLRDGQEMDVPAGEIVQDDILRLHPGDPIVADGTILRSQYLEVDEALLTGESDPVSRKEGDPVLSGSFCVTGDGYYRAEKVGANSFVQRTTTEARNYRYTASPLQSEVNRLIRWLTIIAVGLCLAYIGLYFVRGGFGIDELVRMIAATITSMVPQGLVLMATLALLIGAMAMTRRGAVVNRLSAVEAMAGIDTLCMDKTGTLTTNLLQVAEIRLLNADESNSQAREKLALFAWNSQDRNSKTLSSIQAFLPEIEADLLDQIPFKSQNRFSAVRLGQKQDEIVLFLGAMEVLREHLTDSEKAERIWKEMLPSGWRLLLLAEADPSCPQPFPKNAPHGLNLRPLAMVALSDELRPQASQVLELLAQQGITFKILSGDNPDTVRATISPLGQKSRHPALHQLQSAEVVSGAELEAASNPGDRITRTSIFGRVSPWQKVQIVRHLMGMGLKVAMIGDGVNDILPIKNATLGVAMGAGSRASKTVAGVVLQNNDFSLLPSLLDEGRIILRNLLRSGKLFLNKNVYTLILIVGAIGLFSLPFPFAPQQVTLLNFLTIGIPALLITLDRSTAPAQKRGFLHEVGLFALSTGAITGLATLGLMVYCTRMKGEETEMMRTTILSALILQGWVTLFRTLRKRDVSSWWFTWLVPGGMLVFLAIMYIPLFAHFFELMPLELSRWALILAVSGTASAILLAWDAWLDGKESPAA
ncbi:MAG: cation-translocating P-type ATPase [Gemmataceae bacterium]